MYKQTNPMSTANDMFIVRISLIPDVVNCENLLVSEFNYAISDDKLGQFMSMITVLLFTSKSNITCGLQLAASFYERKKIIKKYFEAGKTTSEYLLFDKSDN